MNKFKKYILVILVTIPLVQIYSAPYAIISAMPKEINHLENQLIDAKKTTIQGVTYYQGKLANKSVVVAALGVGNINTAAGTAILIDRFKPKAVILIGVAGGFEPNNIIIATRLIYYNFGIKTVNNKFTILPTIKAGTSNRLNPLYLSSNRTLVNSALIAKKTFVMKPIKYKHQIYKGEIKKGSIVTTDQIINNAQAAKQLYKATNATANDMESFGVSQICYQNDVPFIVIRGVSDNFNKKMYGMLVKPVSNNVQNFVIHYLKELS